VSVLREIRQEEGINLSAKNRDTEDYQNLAAQSPPFIGIDEARRQQRRTPARNFDGLAAQSGEGKRGKRIGG
jgi:hypothetical protein